MTFMNSITLVSLIFSILIDFGRCYLQVFRKHTPVKLLSLVTFGMSILDPPFALDDDIGSIRTINTERSFASSTGFKKGGPKEARLFRVAILSGQKEVDHLHPVKIRNIPRTASPTKLEQQLKRLANGVEDVYIPEDLKRNVPKSDFAIVRLKSKEEAEKLLQKAELEIDHDLDSVKLQVSPLNKQRSKFSNGTGYMGITCEAFDDGTRNFNEKVAIMQDIKFENVLSRNGAPWSSQRELKFLGKKMVPNAHEMYSIRIENIPTHIELDELKELFSGFGEVGEFFCPKPLHVNEYLKTKDPNCGYGFVRFLDVRDMKAALKSLENKEVVIDGNVLRGEEQPPLTWPTEKTRRYY